MGAHPNVLAHSEMPWRSSAGSKDATFISIYVKVPTIATEFGPPRFELVGLAPNFTILDRSDMEDVLNLLRARMGLASRERRFPKKGTVAEVISMARNKRRDLPEEIEFDFAHLVEHQADIVELAAKYNLYKRERGLLDYDDLLDRLLELGWLKCAPGSRALELTSSGKAGLSETFQIEINDEGVPTSRLCDPRRLTA